MRWDYDMGQSGDVNVTGLTAHAPGGKVNALTSLRFFAAASVALFHVPYTLPQLHPATLMPSGYLGVNFFFILSGFILAYTYAGQSSLSIGRFFIKRFARIYPVHMLLLLIWIALFFTSWGNSTSDKLHSLIPNILLLHAWFPGPLYNLGYNAVSWSISVEAFFYLLFPFIRKPSAALLWCCLTFSGILIGVAFWDKEINSVFPDFFYFDPLARSMEFSAGILLFHISGRLSALARHPLFLLASIVLLGVAVSKALPYVRQDLQPVLLLPFMATLILGFYCCQGWIKWIMSMPGLVLLGEASYSFYMLHHMLFRLLNAPLAASFSPTMGVAVAFGITALASIVLYLGFEKPSRSWLIRKLGSDGVDASQNLLHGISR
ncbi:MAG: acyltransferase [Parvibaculaceae bacterium]|nr:acyltransferase [Parvibaculaceae bacterium]